MNKPLARYFQQSDLPAVMTPLSAANTGSEMIGQAISQVGVMVDQVAQKDEAFWVQQQMMEIDDHARNTWEQQINSSTNGAEGFQTGYLGALDDRYEVARQSAPNGRARRQLEMQMLEHRNSQAAAAQGFAAQEKYEFRKHTIERDVDNFSQEIWRNPGVAPWQPEGSLITAPGLGADFVPAEGFYSSGLKQPHTNLDLPDNLSEWASSYYSPRDFADGPNMATKSGGVMVAKDVVQRLDWVTDQFGMGKLQVNSSFRTPESNVARAESGPEGPHTKGQSMDIQVRHLPQGEKDRLYSLFKAAGFNAFGFGEGVLHVEKRPGGGDHQWTYGSTKPYGLVPVMGPGGKPTEAAGSYANVNQYPYLAAFSMTASNETGTTDLATASLQIAREADGTISVGALGLNSSGLLSSFLGDNADLGITAKPGTPEFAAQWDKAVRADPEGVVGRQIAFHEAKVVRPAQTALQAMGAGAMANDPRAIAFAADLIIQYGPALARKHIAAGRGAADPSAFVSAVTASTKASLDADFRTALTADPSVKQGLINRIDTRAASAMNTNPGHAIATGNVPRWNGPVPGIEDMPEFNSRFARIDTMVDTIGGTPAQRRQIKDQLRGQVVKAWVSRVADINPSAAMSILMSGKYDNELSIGDTQALTTGAQSAYRVMESEIRQKQKDLVDGLKIETSQLLADEIASVATTGKSLGQLSPAHVAVMSDKDKADLAFAGFTHKTSKEISSSHSSDLPAILQELEPAGDGFADELRRYQFAQEQIAKRLELQKSDPAALALQQAPELTKQWNTAFASNDPGQVSAAIAVVRAAQERLGVKPEDIRSMPQATMTTFEQLLTKAEDADQAFANLMQIQQMFGPNTEQVLGEMEKSGMAKGWKEAAQLVGAGHMLASKALTRVVQEGEFGDDGALGVRLAMDGRPDVARKIFDGRLRRKQIPGLMPTGKDEDLDMNVKQIIGDHLGNALDVDGALFNTVREAALSVYAADLPFGATLDGSKIEAAIDAVTGGVLKWNADGERGKFIAPVAGMTQQEFDRGVWDLDNQALENAYVGYAFEDEPLNRDQLAWTQFVSAGDGKYFIEWPGNGLARDSDGLPFVLDYTKAVQESRERFKAQQARDGGGAEGRPGTRSGTEIMRDSTREFYNSLGDLPETVGE